VRGDAKTFSFREKEMGHIVRSTSNIKDELQCFGDKENEFLARCTRRCMKSRVSLPNMLIKENKAMLMTDQRY
jgi:hypothetical protein